MKKRIALCVSCLLLCLCSAMAAVNIIPKPMSVEEKEGEFVFTKGFTIGYSDASLQPAATYLQEVLENETGFRFKTKLGKGKVQLSLVLGRTFVCSEAFMNSIGEYLLSLLRTPRISIGEA